MREERTERPETVQAPVHGSSTVDLCEYAVDGGLRTTDERRSGVNGRKTGLRDRDGVALDGQN